jgi:hypothetical protein
MNEDLSKMTPKELRALLSAETKMFLWALDLNEPIEILEEIRARLRSIADVLKEKETKNKLNP